jgi:hypothetical protein
VPQYVLAKITEVSHALQLKRSSIEEEEEERRLTVSLGTVKAFKQESS